MQKIIAALLFILCILQVTEIHAQDTPEPPPPLYSNPHFLIIFAFLHNQIFSYY